jgi:hypothetical protein
MAFDDKPVGVFDIDPGRAQDLHQAVEAAGLVLHQYGDHLLELDLDPFLCENLFRPLHVIDDEIEKTVIAEGGDGGGPDVDLLPGQDGGDPGQDPGLVFRRDGELIGFHTRLPFL